MKAILVAILRVMALVIIFTVLLTIASSLTTPRELLQHMTQEQISQSTAALPLVKSDYDSYACLSCPPFTLAWLETGRGIGCYLLWVIRIAWLG